MFILFIVVILIIAILMSIVVLLQSGKGGGLAGISGGQTTQILGARQAPDLLEKVTWVLGWSFLALSVLASRFDGNATTDRSILQENADQIEAPLLPGSPTVPGPDAAGETPAGPPAPAPAEEAPAATE